jgi:hypothetical protein
MRVPEGVEGGLFGFAEGLLLLEQGAALFVLEFFGRELAGEDGELAVEELIPQAGQEIQQLPAGIRQRTILGDGLGDQAARRIVLL